VKDGRVTDEVIYLSAMEESRYTRGAGQRDHRPEGAVTEDMIVCRHAATCRWCRPGKVDFMDVSPSSSRWRPR